MAKRPAPPAEPRHITSFPPSPAGLWSKFEKHSTGGTNVQQREHPVPRKPGRGFGHAIKSSRPPPALCRKFELAPASYHNSGVVMVFRTPQFLCFAVFAGAASLALLRSGFESVGK